MNAAPSSSSPSGKGGAGKYGLGSAGSAGSPGRGWRSSRSSWENRMGVSSAARAPASAAAASPGLIVISQGPLRPSASEALNRSGHDDAPVLSVSAISAEAPPPRRAPPAETN